MNEAAILGILEKYITNNPEIQKILLDKLVPALVDAIVNKLFHPTQPPAAQ